MGFETPIVGRFAPAAVWLSGVVLGSRVTIRALCPVDKPLPGTLACAHP